MNKYIIGSGISGLAFAYYNPDYIVIGDSVGGRLNKKFFENIIYCHVTPETTKFLTDVGIKFTKKTQLIKYFKDKKVTQTITVQDKINLIRKKLDDETIYSKDLTLSTQDYYITIYEFSFSELISKILEKVKVINDKVIRITDKEIITENTSYEYSEIVSTINANIFWKLYYKTKDIEFKSKPITFVLCDSEFSNIKGATYDMLYVIDDDYKMNRISKKPGTRNTANLLYEFTGVYDINEVKNYLPQKTKILEHYIDYGGIVFTDKNNIPPKNVRFVGRFATYNHSDKLQDVLKEAMWTYDLRHIFNRQASFTSKRIDFNKIDSLEEKEKETQTLILHLYNELAEVLDAINYKLHKKRHSVDIDNVKEELIDSFKYLLNLFLIWDVTPQEFVKLFNDKSDIVEKRFMEEFKDGK